jgi:threonine/homoserine/homoserine lactone efflux protein
MPERWRLFVAATIVIAATPGPNMLFVMTSSVRAGFRRSFAAMAGCLTGVVAMMAVSAAGLGAVLKAEPKIFSALKLAGAAYLAYLGLRMWLDEPSVETGAPLKKTGLYRQGLFVSLSNPKAILFAAAFLPQFLDADKPRAPQFAVLVSLFAVIEVSCYFAYAAGGRRLSAALSRPAVRRGFDRAAGTLFAGFAAMLALSS